MDTACQDAQAAKHMPMDVFRLCGVPGFLEEFLDSRYTASFLELFDPIANKDMEASFLIERGILPDSTKPSQAHIVQRPGRGAYNKAREEKKRYQKI